MKHSVSNCYTGKPVCAVHLARQFATRCGFVTAQRDTPMGHKLTPRAVSAVAARRIAECQPGGAVVVWQGDEKSCEFALVYSRQAMA